MASLGHCDYEELVAVKFLDSSGEYPFDVLTGLGIPEDIRQAPYALRLAASAFSGRFSVPEAPEQMSRSLYAKAKEVINSCVDHPTLESLQMTLMASVCASSFGNIPALLYLTGMAFRM
ncbi:hypothetical protein HDU67_001390, partial [Dinochytrium kinnereticum]